MTRGEKICAFIEAYCLIPEALKWSANQADEVQRKFIWMCLITRIAKDEARLAVKMLVLRG